MNMIHEFHGYKVCHTGIVYSKTGKPLATEKRPRRGGGYDITVRLYINKKNVKFTLSRLNLSCFKGPGYGYEANHLDRNPENNHIDNLEWATPSENQKHWRRDT